VVQVKKDAHTARELLITALDIAEKLNLALEIATNPSQGVKTLIERTRSSLLLTEKIARE
jgi:hypothetical protein